MLTIGNVFALGESGTIDRSEPSKKRFGLSDGIDFRWYSCDKTLGNSNAWTCLGMRLRHAWVCHRERARILMMDCASQRQPGALTCPSLMTGLEFLKIFYFMNIYGAIGFKI